MTNPFDPAVDTRPPHFGVRLMAGLVAVTLVWLVTRSIIALIVVASTTLLPPLISLLGPDSVRPRTFRMLVLNTLWPVGVALLFTWATRRLGHPMF